MTWNCCAKSLPRLLLKENYPQTILLTFYTATEKGNGNATFNLIGC